MGLQEKQAWARINDQIKETEKKISDVAGTTVSLAIDEAGFNTPALIDDIPSTVLTHVASGLEDLCSDNLAKEAVQSTVKKIVLKKTSADQWSMKLDNGTLNVEGNFSTEFMSGLQYPHANDYKTFLTQNL